MKMLSITGKDLQVFLKDRGAVFMLFLLPFVFILGFALIGRNVSLSGSDTGQEAVALVVVNHDPGGAVSEDILNRLESGGKYILQLQEQAETENQLNQSTLRIALFIPAGFSADVQAGKQASLRLVTHPLANESDLMAIERSLARATREYLMLVYLNKGLEQMAEMQAANPQAQSTFSEEHIQQQVAQQQAQAEQRPLIRVVETSPVEEAAEDTTQYPALGQVITLGMAVLFVFLGAQNTAMSIFREKKLGSFRRLMAAPIGKASLLGGKLLPNVILGLVQIVVIFLTGGYLIGFLGVNPLDFRSDPLGLAVTALVTAVCSASLGILIASLAKTESQVGGLSTTLLFAAGLLAGSFIPLFLFPEGLVNIARFLPHYWANQAFFGLVFRGQTLAQIWPNILALLAFTLAFFGMGLWRFKFD